MNRSFKVNARIGLDATYSLGEHLSGVGVYSRELMNGLAAGNYAQSWDWFYRTQRYWRALLKPTPRGVRVRRLSDSGGNRDAVLFHGLNQRLPRLRFRRQVATFHDLFVLSGEYSTPDFRERFAAQAREAAAASDLIIAVSAFTASQVEHFLNVPATRIRVIPHGVLARRIPALPRERVILCIGAIQRRKNQAALVRAFRAAPKDWKLVLAGSHGFGAEETLEEIANSPVRDRITVTGYLSDDEIAAWYARAMIFAFPSLDEGFGMPALEAMSAGITVITSNTSALAEVCPEGTAMRINPANDEELAGAIELLTAEINQEVREKLIAAGYKHAAQFQWADAVARTTSVYEELIGPGN